MNRSVVALVSFALVISFALATSGCGAALRKAVSAMGRSGGKPAAKGAAAAAGKASAKAAGAASARAASKAGSKAGSRSSGKGSSNVWWKVAETAGNEALQRSIDLTPSTESRSTYVPPSVSPTTYTRPPMPRYEPPPVYIPPYQPPVYQPPPPQYNYQYYPR